MKLEVFQSDKGDCLLAHRQRRHAHPRRRRHARLLLEARRARPRPDRTRRGQARPRLRLAHRPGPHLRRAAADRGRDRVAGARLPARHRQRRLQGPGAPRPPRVSGSGTTPSSDVLNDNAGPIEDALAAEAAVLEAGSDERALAQAQRDLATSISEGIQLSRRVGPDQLGIPLNGEFQRQARDGAAANGRRSGWAAPADADRALPARPREARKEWNDWLDEHRTALERLRSRMHDDAERLGAGEIERFRNAIESRAAELGDRERVTTPTWRHSCSWPRRAAARCCSPATATPTTSSRASRGGAPRERAGHFDVLKVQHHGSEHNLDADFAAASPPTTTCSARTASTRTRPRVIERSPFAGGPAPARPSGGPRAPFKFWFNSSSTASEDDRGREHMAEVESLVERLARDSDGRLRFAFLDKARLVVR